MPPKARSNALRGPGRPKKAPAADTVEVAVDAPKRRGRPAKNATIEEPTPVSVAKEAPKKRGRPSLKAPEPVPEPAPKKARGRPPKEAATAAIEAVEKAPKQAPGRPRKDAPVARVAPTTPKRGRPARTAAAAMPLNRVAGSPRVAKRSSPRTKTTKTIAAAPRLAPHVRSKLRTRLPPAKKIIPEEPVRQPAKRGRPARKAAVEAPASKKPTGHKATKAAVTKPTKPTKPLAPRKIRGHTMRQIPDKFVAQVDQLLHSLLEADAPDSTHIEEEEGEEEAQEDAHVIAEVEEHLQASGVEDGGSEQENGLLSSEQDRDQYQQELDFSEDAGVHIDMEDHQKDAPGGDMPVVGAPDEEDYEDKIPEHEEHEEPVQEAVFELSMQETVQIEGDAHDDAPIYQQEAESEIIVHDVGQNEDPARLDGQLEVNEPTALKPPIGIFFG